MTPNPQFPARGGVYPVIMCGGSGTRLWPVSRPARPKQFAPLGLDGSLFEQTLARVAGIEGCERVVVVAGHGQREWVSRQLRALAPSGVEASVILEPEGRDSAPAVAAAAHFVHGLDPDGVLVLVASDHHIPSAEAFHAAIAQAVATAREGRIVTLGIAPREASSAYGYIRPRDAAAPVSEVAEFREKPDAATAERYIAEGYLWNSGNFIARAATVLEELATHAPDVHDEVAAALAAGEARAAGLLLGPPFGTVRKVSVDYAVMEPTRCASVVRADLEWSDLGAWDAIHTLLPRDDAGNAAVGPVQLSDANGSLVFNMSGRLAVVHGVEGLNVVVDEDVVYVAPLARSQDVKGVVGRLKDGARAEIDLPRREVDLAGDAARLSRWLDAVALPLWWTHGFDHERGIWREELDGEARPTGRPIRARVQGRQTFVYADAGARGWAGPWRRAVEHGLAAIERYAGEDGLMRTLRDADGTVLDETVLLYDQTFVLLTLAALQGVEGYEDAEGRALAHLDAIERRFDRAGDGYCESGADPYQSNAHMHLLEAALAWREAGGGERWRELADRIVRLTRERFVETNADATFLREFFDADWRPAAGKKGHVVEPGHQFEWAWLLARHAAIAGDAASLEMARGLYASGLRGVDPARGVAVDTTDDRLERVTDRARLWPQTEWLKASLVLAAADGADDDLEARVVVALAAMERYLGQPLEPLWRDKCVADGSLVNEPTPASTLYHIASAIGELRRLRGTR